MSLNALAHIDLVLIVCNTTPNVCPIFCSLCSEIAGSGLSTKGPIEETSPWEIQQRTQWISEESGKFDRVLLIHCWSNDLLIKFQINFIIADISHDVWIFLQAQAMAVDMCSERLQQMSMLEEERQRVAQLRKMQIESEQFRYFEDQLHRQELASRRDEAVSKVPEQTDGSCLSQPPRNHVRLDPNRNKPAAPVPKPAANLAAVQSEWPHLAHICVFYFLLLLNCPLLLSYISYIIKYC